MSTTTCSDANDRNRPNLTARGGVPGKAKTVVRCRLCGQSIALESNFRPTPAVCPHCGLKFVFDPQEQPLPVRGMRLRLSEVVEAQRRAGPGQPVYGAFHRRHEAHVPPPAVLPPRRDYLAWAGAFAMALAGFIAIFGLWRR